MTVLQQQFANQYSESRNFFWTRKLRQVRQLALLNNLRRGDENIASTLLFSFFHRVLSNLYEDKPQVKFVPTEEMDNKKIEALNKLAINDFREMDMPQVEYDWLWNTCFFGKGYVETSRFNEERKLLEPQSLNPLACGTDPFFAETQEWRYYWKWILKSGWEIKQMIDMGVIDGIKSVTEIPAGYDPDLWNFKIQIDQAKNLTNPGSSSMMQAPTDNIYQILEIYSTDLNGNKMVAWIDKGFNHTLMSQELDFEDGENGTSLWPIVTKELFRQPNSSVSFSVPDLIEDKHRAKNVLLNLAYIAAKDEANPIYQYNPSLVKDVTQLFQRQISQHIPVDDVQAAIAPLNGNPALTQSLLSFLTLVQNEAQDPIGSGITYSPTRVGKETATKAALDQQTIDMTQSLQNKIIQLGGANFWSHWYQRYLHKTAEGDKKIIALTSVKGVSFETISLDDIKTKYPPKVMILSTRDAEYKEQVNKKDLMQVFPSFAQVLDPAGFKNFNKFIFLPKFIQDSSVLDLVLPKSIDEIKALSENESLNNNQMADVKETDDHETHLYVHASAKNTPAAIAHRFWHEESLAILKKTQFEQNMNQQMQGSPPPQETNMMQATNPLQQITQEANQNQKVV